MNNINKHEEKANKSTPFPQVLTWLIFGLVLLGLIVSSVIACQLRPRDVTWFEYWYYIAGIATPLIALGGFIFIGKQVSIAKEQSETAKKQADTMNEQLQQEIEARRLLNLPVFILEVKGTFQNPTTTEFTHVYLTNCTDSPAFEVKGKIDHHFSSNLTVDDSSDFQVFVSKNSVKINFPIFPSRLPFTFNYIIEYKNISGERYSQIWKIEGMRVTILQPPKLINKG